MNTSELLSGAGNVAVGVREQEETLRAARLRQLQIEDANRQDELRRQMNAAPAPAAPMGNFNDLGPAQEVLPGLKPPREYVPSAAPAPAPVVGKPAPVPFGTQASVDAVRANPAISLTREQFLALPKSEQQRIFKEWQPKNMVGGTTVIRGPVAPLGVSRAIAPYDNKTKVKSSRTPTFDEYLNSLPSGRAAGPGKRGGAARKPTAVAGNLATDADTAIANVLGREGGYSNNPNDTGGETNFGISSVNNPDVDVKTLTPEEATAVYKARYWDAINADSLPPAIREIAFDAAVQHGPGTAKNLIRMSGGDPQRLLAERKKLYDAIVANNPSQREFYDGWMNRLAGLAAKIAGGVVSSANAASATGPVGDVSGIAEGGGSGTIVFDPQANAKPGVKSAAETKTPAQFYLANPDAVSHDMRVVQQQRAELVQLAGMYQRSGMGQQYMEARAKVQEIDNNLVFLAGMQGIRELQEANDPRRLAKAWSYKEGIPIEFVPRTDNTFDVMVNGTRTAQGVPRDQIMDTALSMFDPAYRDRKGKMSEDAYKSQLKREEDTSSQTAQMIREIAVAGKKGNLDMALEWAKQNWGWEIKGPAADGTYLIKPPGEAPRWFDPAGEVIDIDGVQVTSRGAKPIAGLTTGAR